MDVSAVHLEHTLATEARVRAVLSLRLPLVAVADDAQLSLDLGGSDR